MKPLSIRQYVSRMTLLPLIALAIGLEMFFLRSLFSNFDLQLKEQGELIARQLASSSEYGLFSGNRAYLQGLAQGAVQQPDVRAVFILDASSVLIHEERRDLPGAEDASGRAPPAATRPMAELAMPEPQIRSSDKTFRVTHPITTAQLALDEPAAQLPAQRMGTVIVEISRVRTEKLKSEMLWSTIAATAAFLALILYLAHLTSRRITRPVGLLSDAVQSIGQGNLETRVTEPGRIAELDILAGGINEMAAKLQRESANLQQQVEERTFQATQARQSAERANAAKSKFLAAASHDLRQPLHAQGLFLGVLARTELTAYQRELLSSARASLDASAEMLNTLLDFSRIEAGVVKPQARSFPLQPLLNKIENEFAPQADAKGLAYRTRETYLAAHSDPMLVELILRNLVSNAIRYTERGGVLVGCRRRGKHAVLEVWDTGIGIEPAQHQEIFREFHQLGNPERDTRKGLGLGLAISDGLARTLDHGLSLASRPVRGTVFRLTLPVAAGAAPQKESAAVHRNAPLNLRVLVIDDDETVRAAMRHLLGDWGCECVAVESPEDALAAARVRAPDVVISDYRLRQQRTGAEAIAALRALLGESLPALLITGDTAPERLREAQATGIPLLHKPVSPAGLRGSLADVLESARPAGFHPQETSLD